MTLAVLDVTFNYDDDTAFSSTYPYDTVVKTYDIKSLATAGMQSDVMRQFKSLFKFWGKDVIGIDDKQSGGYCFKGDAWMNGKMSAWGCNPPAIMGYYPFKQYDMLAKMSVKYDRNLANHRVHLISLCIGDVRFAAIIADMKAARVILPNNQIEVVVDGVPLPFPINVAEGERPLGESRARVSFTLDVRNDMRLIAYGVDHRTQGAYLNFDSATGLGILHKDLYKNLALHVEQLLEKNDLALALDSHNEKPLTSAELAVRLLTVQTGKPVESNPGQALFRPQALGRIEGFGDLPDAPKGYIWMADVNNILYLVSIKGDQIVMPYDVLDLLDMLGKMSKVKDVNYYHKIDLARQIREYQNLYDY